MRWRERLKAEQRATLGESLYMRGVRWLIARREAGDAGPGAAAEVDRRLREAPRELTPVQVGLFVLGFGERLAFRAWVGGVWQRWYEVDAAMKGAWVGRWLPESLASYAVVKMGPVVRAGQGPYDREVWS